jgi:tripartite-type tricarboxylate transporter receptor subunit TctC
MMFRFWKSVRIAALAASATLAVPEIALAQGASDPLAALDGKTIRFIIGAATGDTSDVYSRAFLAAMEALLPRTTILAQNLPGGAGALALVESLSSTGDAIVLVNINSSAIYTQLRGDSVAAYDLTQFQWIGAMANNQRLAAVRTSLGIDSLEGLLARGEEAITPVTSAGSAGNVEATFLGTITDLDLKIVVGVDDEIRDALLLAGDADLSVNSYATLKPMIDAGTMIPIVRLGSSGGYPAALDAVPTLADVARAGTPSSLIGAVDTLNRISRVMVAKPGTDPAVVGALRAVFDQALARPELAGGLARAGLTVEPTSGAEAQRLISDLLGDAATLALVRQYFTCGQLPTEAEERACLGR